MSNNRDSSNADFAARLLAASSSSTNTSLPSNSAASNMMVFQNQLAAAAAAYTNPMMMHMSPFGGYNPYAMYGMQNANPFGASAFGWPGMGLGSGMGAGMTPDYMMNMAALHNLQQQQQPTVTCTETFQQAMNKMAQATASSPSTTTTPTKQIKHEVTNPTPTTSVCSTPVNHVPKSESKLGTTPSGLDFSSSDLATLADVATSLSASPVQSHTKEEVKVNGVSNYKGQSNSLKRKATASSVSLEKHAFESAKPAKGLKPSKKLEDSFQSALSSMSQQQAQANLQALASLSGSGLGFSNDVQMNPQLLNASAMAWAALLGMGMQSPDGTRSGTLEASQSPGAASDESRKSGKHLKKHASSSFIKGRSVIVSSDVESGTKSTDSGSMDETIDSVIRQQNELALDMEIRLANETSTALKGCTSSRHSPLSVIKRTPTRAKSTNGCISSLYDSYEKCELAKPTGHSITHSPLPARSLEESPLDLSCKTVPGNSPKGDTPSLNHEEDSKARNPSTSNKRTKSHEESLIRKPLVHGWRRQTCIRSISSNGIRGDVMYYAPCGKKLCSYPEVLRYLQKEGKEELDKDNFSFSSKVIVGEFLQIKPEAGKAITRIGEDEVHQQIEQAYQNTVAKKLVAHNSKVNAHPRLSGNHSNLNKRQENHKDVSGKMQQMLEALGRTQHHKLNKQHLELLNRQVQKTNYYQQLMMGLDHDKMKRYFESQSASSVDRKPADTNGKVHDEETSPPFLKLKQSKVPTEDLELEQSKTLPDLEPIAGMDTSSKTFADLLMVMEFVNNFGHVLRIDPNDVPSLPELHAGVMNDTRYIKNVRQFTIVLLTLVIEYPGLPAGPAGRTLVGQVARDLPINKENMDELLRMFLAARSPEGKKLSLPLQNAGFECLSPSKKAAILAFMCNELLYCRNVVREIESNVEEVTRLKGERWIKEGRVRLLRGIQATKRVKVQRAAEGLPNDEHEDMDPETVKMDDSNKDNDHERPVTPVSPAESTDSESRTIAQVRDTLGQSPPSSIVSPSPALPVRQLPPGFGGSMGGKPKVMIPGIGQAETVTDEEKAMDVDQLETLINTLNYESEEFRKGIITTSNKVRAQPVGEDRYHRLYWSLPSMQDAVLVESCESSAVNNPTFDVDQLFLEKNPTSVNTVALNVVEDLVTAVVNTLCDHTKSHPDDVKKPIKSRKKLERPLKRIPYKCQRGWWALRGAKDIDRLQKGFLMRGIRERNLHRMLGKLLEQNEEAGVTVPSLVVPNPQRLLTGEHCDSQRLLKILDAVTAFQEKILHANVHKRNWRPLSYQGQSSTDATISKSISSNPLQGKQAAFNGPEDEGTQDSMSSSTTIDSLAILNSASSMNDKSVTNFDRVELLKIIKERVLDAEQNLERRYLKQPYNHGLSPLARLQLLNEQSNEEDTQPVLPDNNLNDVPCSDEKSVEYSNDGILEAAVSPSEAPAELERWRSAVMGCKTGAQLVLCIIQLDKHVAWERSIMRASCQICTGGENESELLLCDGCDRGFHTYCFKPCFPCIPDGDWFCPMCVTKASNKPCCILCCKQEPESQDHCLECNRNFHKDCLAPLKGYTKSRPTAAGAPLVTWTCPDCLKKTSPIKALNHQGMSHSEANHDRPKSASPSHTTSNISNAETPLENGNDHHVVSTPVPAPKVKKKPGRRKIIKEVVLKEKKVRKKRKSKEEKLLEAKEGDPLLSQEKQPTLHWKEACRSMASELSLHKDAWPFQLPVDTRKFPLYKKVIDTPMHIKQVVTNAHTEKYESADAFVSDVNLILDNCRTFNEDDSPVGKAGSSLRKFFNRRWKQLNDKITVTE